MLHGLINFHKIYIAKNFKFVLVFLLKLSMYKNQLEKFQYPIYIWNFKLLKLNKFFLYILITEFIYKKTTKKQYKHLL